MNEAMRCAHCDKPINGEPTYDAEQVWWLGDKAAPFCDSVCIEEASERYWMNVWAAQ